jgi:hypothetical protein
LPFSDKPPAVARSGVAVCRKIKLKNFYDPKPAGGCGVVPISSAKDLFSHALTLPALRSQHDLFIMLRCNGLATNRRSVALAASGEVV